MTTGREIDRLIDIAADQVRKGHSVDEAVEQIVDAVCANPELEEAMGRACIAAILTGDFKPAPDDFCARRFADEVLKAAARFRTTHNDDDSAA
jgi:hypothetical protein